MPTTPKSEINQGGGLPPEGWHLVKVGKCEVRTSQAGDRYYNVALKSPDGGTLAFDNIMLEGKGNGLGFAKLVALGAAEDRGDELWYEDAQGLPGLRAYAYLIHEEYDGKKRCKVDISQGRAGYLPEGQPPPGYEKTTSDAAEEDDFDF